jgi:hypothetical protein
MQQINIKAQSTELGIGNKAATRQTWSLALWNSTVIRELVDVE